MKIKNIHGQIVDIELNDNNSEDYVVSKTFSAVIENKFAQNENNTYSPLEYKQKKYFITECIKSGITNFFDVSPNYILSADVYAELNQDACIGVRLYPQDDITDEYINECTNLIKNKKPNASVALVVDNITLYSEEQIMAVVNFAKCNNMYIYTNVSMTLDEVGECDKMTGMSPIYYLESLGVLDRKCVLGGCVYLDKDEIELLNSYNTKVCVRPSTDMLEGNGIAPIYSMIGHGLDLCIGIGDDTTPDILKELDLITCTQSGVLNIQNAISKSTLFEIVEKPIIDFDCNSVQKYIVYDASYGKNFVGAEMTKIVNYLNKDNLKYVIINGEIY